MRFEKHGENLTQLELQEIKNNFYISKHAQKRLLERGLNESEISGIIENPFVAYFNIDKSINVAKDEFYYLVFVYEKESKKYKLVTYKEPSNKKVSVLKKQMLAKLGMKRAGSNRV